MNKICFITSIYGGYELSCKKFVKQTEPTDFICFTDNEDIVSNGWIIDTNPYHLTNKSPLDNDSYINSICNNKHTFNTAKYYKQAFNNIPRLKDYDVVVWLDGTIEIRDNKTSEYILKNIYKEKIIGWHHETRSGLLSNEVEASMQEPKYISTNWQNQSNPYQDVSNQFKCYLNDGYDDLFFKNMHSHTPNFGVWVTCFVAFLQKDKNVKNFLDMWYLQTLKYTTQDQVGFPYVCQKTNIIPYTLPDWEEGVSDEENLLNDRVWGVFPHQETKFYIKHGHGM